MPYNPIIGLLDIILGFYWFVVFAAVIMGGISIRAPLLERARLTSKANGGGGGGRRTSRSEDDGRESASP